MTTFNRKEPFLLLLGDIFFYLAALWLTLLFRYQIWPSWHLWNLHLGPFSLLIAISVVVFFISGLYEKHTLLLKSRLPMALFNAQVSNTIIAVLFFYFVPALPIAPRSSLLLYLVISFLFILWWRLYGFAIFGSERKRSAILIGSGTEFRELVEEINNNRRYSIRFDHIFDLAKTSATTLEAILPETIIKNQISVVVLDLHSRDIAPALQALYRLVFSKVQFVDFYRLYGDIFDRVPLSIIQDGWFLENISLRPKITYDFLKRTMDVLLAIILGVLALVISPFVWLMIKLDDGGPALIFQDRVGRDGQLIRIIKFRTLRRNDVGRAVTKRNNLPTRVGRFLRRSRIDELPQLWNVFRGDLSLIGPRPELPALVSLYEKEIRYYPARHLIKPGLSGWAQIYHDKPPKFGTQVEGTKEKLAYDIYYIKNRSLMMDVKIAFRTLKILVSRSGL